MGNRLCRSVLGLGTCLAAAALAVAGCGGSNNDTTTGGTAGSSSTQAATASGSQKICAPAKTVGIVDLIAQSPIDYKTDQMALLAAKRLGWKSRFVDAGGDPNKANQAIQGFVTQHVDMIIDTSVDAAPIRSSLQAAKNAGIPVFEVAAGNEPSDLFTAMYNEDETVMGRILAEHIVKTVPNAKIGDLSTKLNYAGVLRENAVQKVVKGSGGRAQIVANTEVDLSNPVVNTQKAVSSQLTAHPDINAMYLVFDNMAAAAVSTVRGASKTGQVKLYTYFTTPANVKMLKSGQLEAVADANLPAGAAVAFDQYLGSLKGQKIDPEALKKSGLLEYQVVSKDDLPRSGSPFDNAKTLQPFLEKWAKQFPCSK